MTERHLTAPDTRRRRRRFQLLSCAVLAFGFVGVGLSAESDPGDNTGGPRFRSAGQQHLHLAP